MLDLNDVVQETEKMLRRLIGEDILLTAVLDPNISRVKVDPGQIEQVLMNLAVNARDAMPQGGKLTIETSQRRTGRGLRRSARRNVKPGRYVLLAVSDTGCGMTPEVKAHIFEPFFTTKGPGKGTGWGWRPSTASSSRAAAHQRLQRAGPGTTFKIYLPAVEEQLPARQAQTDAANGNGRAPRRSCWSRTRTPCGASPAALQTARLHGAWRRETARKALRLVEKHRAGSTCW